MVGPIQKKWEQQVGIILRVNAEDVFSSRTGCERGNVREGTFQKQSASQVPFRAGWGSEETPKLRINFRA